MDSVKFEIVVDVPVPVIEPGFIVQVPLAGKSDKTTLPVEVEHVGCVIVPTVGVEGEPGSDKLVLTPVAD